MVLRSESTFSKVCQIKVRNQIQGIWILLLSEWYKYFMLLKTPKKKEIILDQRTVILWDSTSLVRNESRIKYSEPKDWNSSCLLELDVVSKYRISSQQSGGSEEGSGQAGWMDWGQLFEVQQGKMPSPAFGSQQPPALLQAEEEWL